MGVWWKQMKKHFPYLMIFGREIDLSAGYGDKGTTLRSTTV